MPRPHNEFEPPSPGESQREAEELLWMYRRSDACRVTELEKLVEVADERAKILESRIVVLRRVLLYVLAGIELDDNLDEYVRHARSELLEMERGGFAQTTLCTPQSTCSTEQEEL